MRRGIIRIHSTVERTVTYWTEATNGSSHYVHARLYGPSSCVHISCPISPSAPSLIIKT